MCVASAEAQIKTRVLLTLKIIPFNGAFNTLQVAQWCYPPVNAGDTGDMGDP